MSEPYWRDETITLHLGDCLSVLAEMPDASVDAVVTDPPAAISFMGRSWDGDRGGRDRWIAWLAERMEQACRVLKPGGHALVWALPRTSGWTQIALEDAGLEIRDCIVHIFGSGYPKSLDVSKAIDRRAEENVETKRRIAAVAEVIRSRREAAGMTPQQVSMAVVGTPSGACWNWEHQQLPSIEMWPAMKAVLGIPDEYDALIQGDRAQFIAAEREVIGEGYRVRRDSAVQIVGLSEGAYDITAPATEGAARWEGWGTALKPGQEMWWLARKPLASTVAATVLEYGTGAINIAACKVGTERRTNNAGGSSSLQRVSRVESGYRPSVTTSEGEASEVTGRWPSNIVFTHSAACEPVGLRRVRNRSGSVSAEVPSLPVDAVYGERERVGWQAHGDADGLETVEAWNCAPDCPAGELDRQSGASTSRVGRPRQSAAAGDGYGMTHTGSEYADKGGASRFYPVFRYQAKAPTSERPRLDDGQAHECVKSLGLIQWLCRLITPPGGTVLDLFAGSGPVGEACIIEGFRCILIDDEKPHAELIRARLRKDIQPSMFGGGVA